MSPQGNGTAVWNQNDASAGLASVWAAEFSNGSWKPAQLVESNNTFAAYEPRVFFDAQRNTFVAVWLQGSIGSEKIYSSIYE